MKTILVLQHPHPKKKKKRKQWAFLPAMKAVCWYDSAPGFVTPQQNACQVLAKIPFVFVLAVPISLVALSLFSHDGGQLEMTNHGLFFAFVA